VPPATHRPTDHNLLQDDLPSLSIKQGIKLPVSKLDWDEAQAYFLAFSLLPESLDSTNIDECISNFQSAIYQYFSKTSGIVDKSEKNSTNQNSLKRAIRNRLKQLKNSNANTEEIQAVSKALRTKMPSGNKSKTTELCANSRKYKTNPWKFMNDFEPENDTKPSFDNTKCENYFSDLFSEKNSDKFFNKPDWMPDVCYPTNPMNHTEECPTYQDITKIIRSMKSSSSPCPLDGISVIIFKRCPILRTYLAKIISTCWRANYFPKIWRRASVSLLYKKGDPEDPQNFRPIALQPALGKILSACIRHKIWSFLFSNKLVDTKMQKGFWPGIAGVTEHIQTLNYILKNQKKNNRDIFVVLLDLKNAFGEVHHSLIRFALEQHHIPSETINLIMSQYTNFSVNFVNYKAKIQTKPIQIRRGVLQGDPLSPLLFNIVFDTLMSTLKKPEMKSTGILWGDGITRSFWTQFADDAAVICDSAKQTQSLINLFQRWTTWADLKIRPDKCFCYGATKRNGRYQQIQPTFSVNGIKIPPIEIGQSMTYLGKEFSFSSDAENAQTKITSSLHSILEFVHNLPITPSLKCHAVNLQIQSKLSFLMSHHMVEK